jgi:hypothetical protein
MKLKPVVIAVTLAGLCGASAQGLRCSVTVLRNNPEGYFWPADSVGSFVARATVIVRVRAVDVPSRPPGDNLAEYGTGVLFRVQESLRGRLPGDSLILLGTLVPRDDFNRSGTVPYRMTRPAGQRGDCYAKEYRKEAEYLMLLQDRGYGWTPHWMPLAPLNEQLRGADDPWLAWVKARVVR